MNKTERERPDWNQYGMTLAYAARTRSPDPHFQTGAAAFRADHSTLATGYNGAEQGIEIDWTDREKRLPFVKHAEKNCLKYAAPGEAYYMYVMISPCEACAKMMIDYGVQEIYYSEIYTRDPSGIIYASSRGIKIVQLKIDVYEILGLYRIDT